MQLLAESIGTFTQVPPDLKRFYFGRVRCPALMANEVVQIQDALTSCKRSLALSRSVDPLIPMCKPIHSEPIALLHGYAAVS